MFSNKKNFIQSTILQKSKGYRNLQTIYCTISSHNIYTHKVVSTHPEKQDKISAKAGSLKCFNSDAKTEADRIRSRACSRERKPHWTETQKNDL